MIAVVWYHLVDIVGIEATAPVQPEAPAVEAEAAVAPVQQLFGRFKMILVKAAGGVLLAPLTMAGTT